MNIEIIVPAITIILCTIIFIVSFINIINEYVKYIIEVINNKIIITGKRNIFVKIGWNVIGMMISVILLLLIFYFK